MHAAWFRREVQLGAGVRLEVHGAADCSQVCGVRRTVHRVAGVRHEVRRSVGVRREVIGLQVLWDAGMGVRPAVCGIFGVSMQCIELWAARDRSVVCWGSVVSVPCVGLQAVGVSR